jgi:hypothetical protein
MGAISKMGDRYLRHLLVVGATAIVRYTRQKTTTVSRWACGLLERKPARLVTVAVANKIHTQDVTLIIGYCEVGIIQCYGGGRVAHAGKNQLLGLRNGRCR